MTRKGKDENQMETAAFSAKADWVVADEEALIRAARDGD